MANGTTPETTDNNSAVRINSQSPNPDPKNLFNDPRYKFTRSLETNILNQYRSWSYVFTLGVLPPDSKWNDVNDLNSKIEKYLVLSSAGKGTKKIGVSDLVLANTQTNSSEISKTVDGFNVNSPGRFDMYIDDVVIDSVVGPGDTQAGTAISTNVSFSIYEPYSMNGFIEALQVASIAASYPDYMKAVLCLKVHFMGYRSDASLDAPPEIIPDSTRFFCITLHTVEVTVTEDGTVYKCTATPSNQMGFGIPNVLKSEIKVAGTTVAEVLTNFFKALNEMAADSSNKIRGENKSRQDYYEISCPSILTKGSVQDTDRALLYSGVPNKSFGGPNSNQNEIIKAKMNDEFKEVNVFQLGDPADFQKSGYPGAKTSDQANSVISDETGKDPATQRLVPAKGTVVFSANRQIHDCIAAIVRDSTYVRGDLLTNQVKKAKESGSLMVTYFTVRMEATIQPEFDTVYNKYFWTYRYVLEPFQIPYTRIPALEQGEVDHSPIIEEIKREYNYIYTGKNTDILKFNLEFNNLYFAAIPEGLGNKIERTNAQQSAAPNNTLEVELDKSAVAEKSSKVPNPKTPLPVKIDVDPYLNDINGNTVAGQQQVDPYYRLAQNLHSAILGKTDLVKGKFEILGDPYFLVTGGMGSETVTISNNSVYKTADGQAAINQRDLMILFNFRNPVDIQTTGNEKGFLKFENKLLPFSGIYRVINLSNKFNDGVFTQELDIIRSPGQLLNQEIPVEPNNLKTDSKPGFQVVKDARPSDVLSEGILSTNLDFNNLLGRSDFTLGLPELGSNLRLSPTQQLTPLVGVQGTNFETLPQVGVDINNISGQSLRDIKILPSNLESLRTPKNTAAVNIDSAGSLINNVAGISNAATAIAENISEIYPTVQGAAELVQEVSKLSNNVGNKTQNVVNAVSRINNVLPSDTENVSSKLNLDTSKLSGLSKNLPSKVSKQLSEVANSLPSNVNLSQLENIGLYFNNATRSDLLNLPPAQPEVPTKTNNVDVAVRTNILTSKNSLPTELANGVNTLPGLTNINNVPNSLGVISSGFDANISGNIETIVDKVASAQTQINSALSSISPNITDNRSVEQKMNEINNIVQYSSKITSVIDKSISIKLGSKHTESPLSLFISKSNIQGNI